MGCSTSNDLIKKKIPYKCTQSLGFWLIPDAVKLTSQAPQVWKGAACHLPLAGGTGQNVIGISETAEG